MERDIIENIKNRRSIRTFASSPLGADELVGLKQLIAQAETKGPWHNRIRFALIALEDAEITRLNKLINYGFIKGAPVFLAGIMPEGENYHEDYGYLMETMLLQITALGLGTCWLGGSLNIPAFRQKLELKETDLLPAVIAIGRPAHKGRPFDTLIRTVLQARKRKPWDELFFLNQRGLPLLPEVAAAYQVPLEMVRQAPSASNKQPWRIILDEAAHSFHFYFVRDQKYSALLTFRQLSDLQKIDMGIAQNHFALSAAQLDLKGKWAQEESGRKAEVENFQYIATWKAKKL